MCAKPLCPKNAFTRVRRMNFARRFKLCRGIWAWRYHASEVSPSIEVCSKKPHTKQRGWAS